MMEFALSRAVGGFVCCDVKECGRQKPTWLVMEVGKS